MGKYWIKQGLTKEQATQKVSEVQLRFSKEICITKYGQVKGTEIWQARQDKWQQTLNSKTPEEIERMNQGKGTDKFGNPLPGIYSHTIFKRNENLRKERGFIYFVRFFNSVSEFWKIGITKVSVKERIQNFGSTFSSEIIKINEGSLYNCFKEEQRILSDFSKFRITMDEGSFYSTECFNKDISN